MNSFDESEVRRIAKDVAESHLNRKLVNYFGVIMTGLAVNIVGIGGIVLKLDGAQRDAVVAQDLARDVARKNFTVELAITAEWMRAKLNPGYIQVPIRDMHRDAQNNP